MTAPIQFPTIAPVQAVSSKGRLDGTAELLLAIVQGRQQMQLRRREIELEAQRTESQVSQNEQQTAESKARVEADKEMRQQKLDMLDAGRIASRHILDAVTETNGNLTPDAITKARIGALKENSKLAELINLSFDQQLQGVEKSRTELAQRRSAESGVRVDEKLEGSRVAAGEQQPALIRAQRQALALDNTLNGMRVKGFDAAKLSAATDTWRISRKPWGVVRKQFGLPAIPGGMKESDTFEAAAKQGDEQREAFADNLGAINETINQLGNEGLTPGAYGLLNSNPTGFVSGTMHGAAMNFVPVKQQRLMNAYGALAAFSQTVLVRGAASDRDVALVRAALTTLSTDAPETKAQKALLRNAFVASFSKATPGQYAASLDNMRKIAAKFGVKDPALLAPFSALRPKFEKSDATAVTDPDDAIINGVIGSRRP